jgi:hypothetical protein
MVDPVANVQVCDGRSRNLKGTESGDEQGSNILLKSIQLAIASINISSLPISFPLCVCSIPLPNRELTLVCVSRF